jgi:hypothetical protein
VGWSLVLTRHDGSRNFFIRVIDGSFYARAFTA